MTKKQMLARWHCVKKYVETMGGGAELDVISVHQLNVIVRSSQDLSALVEWGYMEWPDVKAAGQVLSDGQKCFFLTFAPKEYEKEDDD